MRSLVLWAAILASAPMLAEAGQVAAQFSPSVAKFDRESSAAFGFALEEANEAHVAVETDHLLMALIEHTQEVADGLSPYRIDIDSLRSTAKAVRGDVVGGVLGDFTDELKLSLQISVEAQGRFGGDVLRPGHLLLGILSVPNSYGVLILQESGVPTSELREDVLRYLSTGAAGS